MAVLYPTVDDEFRAYEDENLLTLLEDKKFTYLKVLGNYLFFMAYDGLIWYNMETKESEWLFQNLPIMDMEMDPEGSSYKFTYLIEDSAGGVCHSRLSGRIAWIKKGSHRMIEIEVPMEADGKKTHLTMRNGEEILVSKPLVYFERLLQENKSFFKVHRKYIIHLNNMNSFTRGTSEIDMEGGAHIPPSRHRKHEFEEEIHSLIPSGVK